MNKSKNVFISHYHKDDEHLQRLKNRFLEKGYQLKNSSIDSTKPDRGRLSPKNIEKLLRYRIRWAGTFICLIGDRTHTRPWVNYEIEQAVRMGKQIIGVYAHGSMQNAYLPENFEKYGGQTFGWNSVDKMVDAIETGKRYDWEDSDGNTRQAIRNLKTVSC
jgi:hypothetical protein